MGKSELSIAEEIARAAHAWQHEESTGEGYIRHVERVVDLVEGDDAKTVAWLHDVIEDSAVTPSDLLDAGLSVRIVRAVRFLTRMPSEEYAAYIQRLQESGDGLAIIVKVADLRDHLRPNCPPSLRPRYEKAWRTLTGEAFTEIQPVSVPAQ